MTDPLSIIFDDLGICLLGYCIELRCLYILQRHNFTSTLWLWSWKNTFYFYFGQNKHVPGPAALQNQICMWQYGKDRR